MTDRDKIEENEEVLDLNEKIVSKESMFHHKLRKKDKKIKNSESYNNNTIIYVVSMVALFVIWFTAFAQPLAYNNRLLLFNNNSKNNDNSNGSNNNSNNKTPDNSKTSDSSVPSARKSENSMWNVGFIDMILSNKIGKSEEIDSPSFTKTKANFHVLLNEPGDEISYNIVIKNSGTIDAKVSEITVNPINDINDPILFEFSGLEVGDELDAGKSTTVSVNIKYNPNYTGAKEKINKDFVVFINYVQK